MAKVGIFFGSDTGKTRKVAKLIQDAFASDEVAAPVNINKAGIDDLLAYDYLILGTPTLGDGALPGLDADCQAESWAEFVPELEAADLSGKKVALFGLGDQASYGDAFVDALGELYDIVSEAGASVVGFWPNEGYEFNSSNALDGDDFVGLVIDQDNQSSMTAERVKTWVAALKSEFAL
ncbi:flavodoxin [Tolumonas lignilytica]|jgi:flavodoxin, long chain|uniref:flavodoxin n=1 Tax=Tolumonas lignilytica TaxID=1283284 RepID=UPI000463F704|nr:flavodoxin [Tolumonas lignilytica]